MSASSSAPGSSGAGSPTRMAVAFVGLLRRGGLTVPVGAAVTYAEALAAVGLDERNAVYWAGRATLVRRPEDFPVYDRSFSAFWDRRRGAALPARIDPLVVELDQPDQEPDEEGDELEGAPPSRTITVRYSPTETLRHKDFGALTPEELDETRRLMAELRLDVVRRRSRRLQRSARRRGHPDARRTLRLALRSGGEPLRRAHLEASWRPRRVVLLCDISGSMAPYARSLLRFMHVAVMGRGKVEAFALGTRLTRLSRELSRHDPDAALAAAAEAVPDWSGGTRLGEGLKAFNDRFGVRGMARGAMVVVLSDGWDRGDPEQLAMEMARLHRVAYRVVWVNPLKATPGYAPLARGMAAALPYVDDFVEGHSLASLESLAGVMAR
ncbi:MAG TPA: VWA domain-containing protein [Acidimicrobiales bacterium]|nr:VWA domain-containing protein [Acidimicrobiales bacterium]